MIQTGIKVSKTKVSSYHWGINCESWVLNETPGLSVKQEMMPAGAREQLHFHNEATQFFFMLKGTATFFVEDEKIIVRQHEGLTIKRTQKHFVVNDSNERIEFLVVSQPGTTGDRINL